MIGNRPWYRTNRRFAVLLPFLVIGLAVGQTSLHGTARIVTEAVFAAALVAFIVLVTVNARADTR